jgi:DNA-binding response OmpR family regulator
MNVTAIKQLFANLSHRRRDQYPEFRLHEAIEWGDFKIDPSRRTAIFEGRELHLSSEEFDVLVFVIAHPRGLVTPHTVLSTNWTETSRRQTEFLRVLLSLRKKLEAASPGKHYLRTEPWILYRLDASSSRVA